MTYGYWSDLETDGYEWTFRPNACSGIIPTSDGEACVFAAGSPGRIGIGGVGLIEEVIAEAAPDVAERLSRATPRAMARTWMGLRGYIRQSWGPGWALVGDAGCFTDPIGVHGLTDAFRDAELLARAVAAGSAATSRSTTRWPATRSTRDRLVRAAVRRRRPHREPRVGSGGDRPAALDPDVRAGGRGRGDRRPRARGRREVPT